MTLWKGRFKMKQDLTEIVVILDRSGSMSSIKDDVIGGFNSFIEEQRKVEGFLQFQNNHP